tara:strand:+ start:103 stop:1038 length:936 start_codon:yes stop_codon:yes gene_type:complete
MKRLLIDYLDVAPTRNWVDIQTHLNSRLVMTKTRVESSIIQRQPRFKLWQRSDPAKYKLFASDNAIHIGSFDNDDDVFGNSIFLDKCVDMLHSQNSNTEKFITYGTILNDPFDKRLTLERAKFYGRNFDDDSLINLETGETISTGESVDFFSYFVMLPIKGIVDTYYMIANNTMVEMPQMINTIINNDWMVRTLEQHDISLREFIIQPSYKDCVKIGHDMINARKAQVGIDPFGQSRAVRFTQDEFNQTLINRDDITLKVRSNMDWKKDGNYYMFDVDNSTVGWVQFKIMANAYFDFQHVNLSLQKTIVVI